VLESSIIGIKLFKKSKRNGAIKQQLPFLGLWGKGKNLESLKIRNSEFRKSPCCIGARVSSGRGTSRGRKLAL
jgi:hypothetical protein